MKVEKMRKRIYCTHCQAGLVKLEGFGTFYLYGCPICNTVYMNPS